MEREKLYMRIVYAHFADKGKCMCQCVSWNVNVLRACIVHMFCGKRKTVSLCKLECDCVACMYSVYIFCGQGKTKCQ